MGFFICHPCFEKGLCELAYSEDWNPYEKDNIYWTNKCFEFREGGEHFFDWLVDGAVVTGAELHLFDTELLTPRSLYETSPCLTWSGGFATIWFPGGRTGTPMIALDWQCFFYKSLCDDWIVALGTNFLSDDKVDSLRTICVDYIGRSTDEGDIQL